MKRSTTISAAFAALSLAGAGARAAAPAAARYAADPAASRLEFTGIQAGAPFTGVFHKFTAAIDFSPEALASARFDVLIDLGSEDSGDKDRDGTMRGADVFDVAHFPTAHYVTRSIVRTATGYAAQGSLTLHGVTRDVPLAFRFTPGAAGASLTGTAELKRLDFGVGRGDWKNTDWVADSVKVSFSLALKPRP